MTPSIARVPGISRTSQAFRAGLYKLAEKHGWNVDAIAAVISNESGFVANAKNPVPGQTASGLLQWIDSTAKSMFGFGSDQIRTLSAEQQLPLIEKWFVAQLGDGLHRPVDYYLVGWGARPGLALDYTLAQQGQKVYELNRALDVNGDGTIRVSDLDSRVQRTLAAAGGERIDASPLPAAGGASPSSSAHWVMLSTSLLRSCGDTRMLAILRLRDQGPDVLFLRSILGLPHSIHYDAITMSKVRDFQNANALVPDGICGPKTWGVLRKMIGGA